MPFSSSTTRILVAFSVIFIAAWFHECSKNHFSNQILVSRRGAKNCNHEFLELHEFSLFFFQSPNHKILSAKGLSQRLIRLWRRSASGGKSPNTILTQSRRGAKNCNQDICTHPASGGAGI
jgi:hypothetical protein